MGQPKQLLPVDGRPLLRRAGDEAVASSLDPIVVVLGANAPEIRSCVDDLPVRVVLNAEWEEGMGSSVRAGINAVTAFAPDVKGVVIALADQPGFSREHIAQLLDARQRTGKSIVAACSNGRRMPPAYFSAKYFPALRALRGDTGARALFELHETDVSIVEIDGLGDLDTPAEYEAFLKEKVKHGPSAG